MNEDLKLLSTLFGVGVAVAIGKLLIAEEKLTAKLVMGRCILTGFAGVAAAGIVAVIPGLGFAAQVGIGAAIASLGASGIEHLLNRVFRGSGGE